ncbi:hypothetical protein BDW62DRAFT_171862 [Aspergillus aurantiobrunneus]
MSPVELSYSLWARDSGGGLASVPETLSSWDKCMEKSYCKWPVIVGIIVGGVILISVIACIVNCLCCGIRCCTGCCCSCCCPSPRPKRAKYEDDPYNHQPAPMPRLPQVPPVHNTYEEGFKGGYQNNQSLPTYRGAQVARFDTPSNPGLSKMNDDALPAMPSWDHAVTRRVEDTSPRPESVEMEPLNPASRPPHRTPSAPRANGAGYMGPPPISPAVPNDHYPEAHGYDDQNPYDYHSQGLGHSGASPYDQPYRNHSPGGNFHAMSPPPQTFSPGPQYPVGVAISPATEMNRPVPYRQPSPGLPFRQPSPGLPLRQPSPGLPLRQPSPGLPLRQPSPGLPFRQPSPGFNQPPSYRAMSPAMPSSPPPPFTSVPQQVSDPGRPPSLLQSGRKPTPNF